MEREGRGREGKGRGGEGRNKDKVSSLFGQTLLTSDCGGKEEGKKEGGGGGERTCKK